jgi:hypothetical protein
MYMFKTFVSLLSGQPPRKEVMVNLSRYQAAGTEGSYGYSSAIIYIGARRKWVVIATPRCPLYGRIRFPGLNFLNKWVYKFKHT